MSKREFSDNCDEIVTDTTPTATPHPFAAWRAVYERKAVLQLGPLSRTALLH